MQAISSITKSGARWIGRQLKLLLEEVAEDTRSALRASIKAYIVALLAGSSLTATVLAGEHVIQEQLNQAGWSGSTI